MSIKQNGGVFGRNPTFNKVSASQYVPAYNVSNVIANTGGSFYFALHYTT